MEAGLISGVDLCATAYGSEICMPERISIKALFLKPSGSYWLELYKNAFSRELDAKYLLNPEECVGLFLETHFFGAIYGPDSERNLIWQLSLMSEILLTETRYLPWKNARREFSKTE